MTYFVEHLSMRGWFLSVLPEFLKQRMKSGSRLERCYLLDGSGLATVLARISGWFVGVMVEPLVFRLIDVRDEQGLSIWLRTACRDLAQVQEDLMENSSFLERLPMFRMFKKQLRLPAYLAKIAVSTHETKRGSIFRALLAIQICAWKMRNDRRREPCVILFLERRPWLKSIERYAVSEGVSIRAIRSFPLGPREFVQRLLSPETIELLRSPSSIFHRRSPSHPSRPELRIAVEYNGHLNLDQPECYSDLFFWQQSSLSAKDILVLFGIKSDPLNEQKWAQMTKHGMPGLALQSRATTLREAPVFSHWPGWVPRDPMRAHRASLQTTTLETRWLKEQVHRYETKQAYWADLFASEGIRIYLSWYRYDATHCAIADALESIGGITAIYQRAYEGHSSPETAAHADVVFGFSPSAAEIERQSGSIIPYHVTTGYLGDHRFPLLREQAQQARNALKQRGATRFVSFSDENSHENERWALGHTITMENYAFLLEKVIEDSSLGLLIKPKKPSTLRKRLGPVAKLLQRAQETGRCFVYESGTLHSSYPPAAAAMAADFHIHGHLCAGTAGLETTLAGVPTLLLDREGWSVSPLYRLGVGRVVFKDWPSLWEACLEQWAHPGGVPGFGDWSSVLDQMDPFRDGRAAQRMGTYIQWLLEGFKAGLSRQTVMADAAERYTALWGKDKVNSVNTNRSAAHIQSVDSVSGQFQALRIPL